MKYFFSIIMLILLCPFSYTWSSTIIVDINGAGDYTTIQEGIDNSQDGDIVLVYSGIYYENIDYSGKSITVASKYYTTIDESYIENTIIDGNNNGSCVLVKDGGDEAGIIGLTLQHGSGYDDGYDEYGGGISIRDNLINLFNIHNCIIQDNSAGLGGGICVGDCLECNIKDTRIINNFANIAGGGIVKGSSSVDMSFSSQDLCDIYMNYAPLGSDVYNHGGNMTVYVDTFTVAKPDKFYAYSYEDNVTIISNDHKIEQINNDLYVSPDGNNINSGLNWNNAFKNIYYALIMIQSDDTHPNTIYLDEGTYSPSVTGEFYGIGIKDYISLNGSGKECTILDAEKTTMPIQFNGTVDNLIKDCTISNGRENYAGGIGISDYSSLILENSIVKHNNAGGVAQLYLHNNCDIVLKNVDIISADDRASDDLYAGVNTSLLVYDCKFMGNNASKNRSTFGACTLVNNTTPAFINTTISNYRGWCSSGIAMMWSFDSMYLINCTVVDNKDCSEGIIRLVEDSHIHLINTILRNESDTEIWFCPTGPTCSASLEYCNIEGGIDAINTNGNGTVYWGDGNIDEDPLFVGGDPFSYELTKYSPCIDAGTPDTTGLNVPAMDLAGNPRIFNGRIDIGAYECQDTISVDEPDTSFIHNLYLFQNTPNPFTNETEILFITTDYTRVEDYTLSIYNTKGQLVRRFDGKTNDFWVKTKITWDGTDERGRQVAPGTYLYKLEYNGNAVVRKMVRLR